MPTCYPPITNEHRSQYWFGQNSATITVPAYVPRGVLNRAEDFRQAYGPMFKLVGAQWLTDATGLCYLEAALASALAMERERNRRFMSEGKPALSQEQQDLWYHGWVPWETTGWVRPLSGIARYVRMPIGATSNQYEGDFSLSLRQLFLDDMTATDPHRVFEPLRSIDGILAYPPARLAQVDLADTYNMLRHTEENALDVLAQSQDAQTVARISTTQTVTDPIGRLVTGAIVQQTIGNQAVETILPSAGGIGPEGTGVNSGLPSLPPGTPPIGSPTSSGTVETPATGGGGWLAIALPIALLLLPKK